MYLPGNTAVNAEGHLELGTVDTVLLAKKYGTPLFIYDTALIRERIREVKNVCRKFGIKAAYASKAFSCVALYRIIAEEGMSLDVVSGGELFTALKSGFSKEHIHFHGNNKSHEEIELAVKTGIGCIVVDNFYELELLQAAAGHFGKTVNILLRIAPGVSAHTHEYITTGRQDSKFGFDLADGQALRAVELSLKDRNLNLSGVHCHIGSQLFETNGFVEAVNQLYQHIEIWDEKLNYKPDIINVGGGFGIRYTEADCPLPIEDFVKTINTVVRKEADIRDFPYPEIWIEPGRTIVGEAGTTLYTIGSLKEVAGVCSYASVDGGMTDNIRPALYRARYEGIVANRALEHASKTYTISGKCCESSDILVRDLALPKVNSGDILAVFCTGAYGYAMASNYNRMLRPPVVFLENGKEKLVIRRETYEDLLKLEQL